MLTTWTKNLQTAPEKENFNNQLLGARPVLERLHELLDEMEQDLGRTERSKAAYSNANWAYLQAHQNGAVSQITAIKQLINLDQQKA